MAHRSGYVEKHLALIKQYWLQLGVVDAALLDGLELPAAQNSTDPQVRACHHLLWGFFLSMDGDMVNGQKHFLEAEKLLLGLIESRGESIAKNDLFAFAMYEMSCFYFRLYDMKHTWNYLSQARSFAASEALTVVIDITEKTFRLNRFFMDIIPGDMSELDACLDYLRDHGIHYRLIIALYHRMAIYTKLDRLEEAYDDYLEGSALCAKLDMDTYLSAFQMALGIWYSVRKDHQTALRCYKEAYKMTESPYRQALCLENTASLYAVYHNYEKRLEAHLKMLTHCEKHNLNHHIPVICYQIAHYYMDQKKDLIKARDYFKKGYDTAIQMQDQGITLFTLLARIVREYPEFMEKYYHFNTEQAVEAVDSHDLDFCLNRDWNSMKHSFQHALLLYHREHCESGEELLHRLGIKPSTMYAIRQKLMQDGFKLPDLRFGFARSHTPELDPALINYCRGISGLDWKAANHRFQSDALTLLLKHHNYNKVKLSQQLRVSYPTTLQLLKAILP